MQACTLVVERVERSVDLTGGLVEEFDRVS